MTDFKSAQEGSSGWQGVAAGSLRAVQEADPAACRGASGGWAATMSGKRKAEQQPLTECPITSLPINDKLFKKLKMSSSVTKKTLQNTLTNKLGWHPHKVQESWSRDTLIQEYYTALEMQKARALSPSSSPSAARVPSPAKAAPEGPKGGAREQLRSTRGRASSAAPMASPASPVAAARSMRAFVGSPAQSPESSRSALSSAKGARQSSPAGRGSDGGRRGAAVSPPNRRGGSCFALTLRLLLIMVAAAAFVIYLVHGFEGGKEKLIAGAQGNVLANYQGLAALTWKSFMSMTNAKLAELWEQASDFLTTLAARLTPSKANAAVPKDGLVASPSKTAEKPAAPKPVVTVAKEEPQESAAEKARKAEAAKEAEEAAKKAAEMKRKADQKRKEEEEKRKADQKRKEEEERRKAEQKRAEEEEKRKAEAKKRKAEEEERKKEEARKEKERKEKEEQERRRKEQEEQQQKAASM